MNKTFLMTALRDTLTALSPWLAGMSQRGAWAQSARRVLELQSLLQVRTEEVQREFSLRRQVEAKMSEFMLEHQQLLQSLPDGFALADQEGNILEANDALSRMTGWSRGTLLQMHLSQFDAAHSAELPRVRLAPTAGTRKLRLWRLDERPVDVDWSIVPVPGLPRFMCFVRECAPGREPPLRLVPRSGREEPAPAAASPSRPQRARMTAHAS